MPKTSSFTAAVGRRLYRHGLLAAGDRVGAVDLAVTPPMAALGAESADVARRSISAVASGGARVSGTSSRCGHPPAAIVGVIQAADIPLKALHVNVAGAVNLFEAMRLAGVKRVVHISTEETYGDFQAPVIDEDHPQKPLSVYGLTKLAAEHYGRVYSRDHGLECINVRTCWVYGPHLPRLRMPRTFIEAALRGEPIISRRRQSRGRSGLYRRYRRRRAAGARQAAAPFRCL